MGNLFIKGMSSTSAGIYLWLNKRKNLQIESFCLLMLVIYSYGFFISGMNIGATDAHWYQLILHDALIQLNHGIFPTYVGQSQYNFFGSSNIRSPYYLLLGQLIYLISLGQLDAAYVQHLTIFITALSAAFITYFLSLQIIPTRSWISVLLAFLYISCPGVIGLIYCCDMYFVFMSIPFIPLAIYGLVRTHQKDDCVGYFITAIGLSLALMAHPPVAVWTIGICLFFYFLRIFFLRKGIVAFIIVPGIICILNFWQFTSIYAMGLRGFVPSNPNFLNWIIPTIQKDLPGAFLPLGWDPKQPGIPFLQFGYSYWIIFFTGLFVVVRRSCNFLTSALMSCIFLLLILIYPLPLLTPLLWAMVPPSLQIMTSWPAERFYIILATLIGFTAISLIQSVPHSNNLLIKKSVFCVIVLMFSWNIYQTFYFIKYGANISKATSNFWLAPENMYFIANGVSSIQFKRGIGNGHFDPVLKNGLLDHQQKPIPGYDNEQYIIDQCSKKSLPPKQIKMGKPFNQFPIGIKPHLPQLILRFQTPIDKNLLLCFKAKLTNSGINLQAVKPNMNTSLDASIYSNSIHGTSTKIVALPIFHSEAEEILVYATGTPREPTEKTGLTIISYGLIGYEAKNLPIKIDSFTPYKAHFETNTGDTYLEIFKEYFPGYKAMVDGQQVSVMASKDKNLVLIPIKKPGLHHVELAYEGLPIMKVAFYISILTWFYTCLFFGLLSYRKYTLTIDAKYKSLPSIGGPKDRAG